MEIFQSYPFLPSVRKYYRSMAGLDVFEFVKTLFELFPEELNKRFRIFFDTIFQNQEEIENYPFDEVNIYFYLMLRVINHFLNNTMIANKVANLFSKISYAKMKEADREQLWKICADYGLNIKYLDKAKNYGEILKESNRATEIESETDYTKMVTRFCMHFISYLDMAINMRDPKYKLSNRVLEDGYVYVKPRELARLIQEKIRKVFIIERRNKPKDIKKINDMLLDIEPYRELYEYITQEWEKYKPEYNEDFDTIEETKVMETLPPCMNEIWLRLLQGVNLVNTERLVIEFYLLSLGFSKDAVLGIFSTTPDFSESKVRYFINHAQKRGYISYNCSKIKSFGLCYAEKYNDRLCLSTKYELKNPLTYARIKSRPFEEKPKPTRIMKAFIIKETEKAFLIRFNITDKKDKGTWYSKSAFATKNLRRMPIEQEFEMYESFLKET